MSVISQKLNFYICQASEQPHLPKVLKNDPDVLRQSDQHRCCHCLCSSLFLASLHKTFTAELIILAAALLCLFCFHLNLKPL